MEIGKGPITKIVKIMVVTDGMNQEMNPQLVFFK